MSLQREQDYLDAALKEFFVNFRPNRVYIPGEDSPLDGLGNAMALYIPDPRQIEEHRIRRPGPPLHPLHHLAFVGNDKDEITQLYWDLFKRFMITLIDEPGRLMIEDIDPLRAYVRWRRPEPQVKAIAQSKATSDGPARQHRIDPNLLTITTTVDRKVGIRTEPKPREPRLLWSRLDQQTWDPKRATDLLNIIHIMKFHRFAKDERDTELKRYENYSKNAFRGFFIEHPVVECSDECDCWDYAQTLAALAQVDPRNTQRNGLKMASVYLGCDL